MWRDVNIWLPQLVWFAQLLREALASSHTLRDSRAWSAAGQPPHPPSQSQGWSQEGGVSLAGENQAGEDIPSIPTLAQSQPDKCLFAKGNLICYPLCSATAERLCVSSRVLGGRMERHF